MSERERLIDAIAAYHGGSENAYQSAEPLADRLIALGWTNPDDYFKAWKQRVIDAYLASPKHEDRLARALDKARVGCPDSDWPDDTTADHDRDAAAIAEAYREDTDHATD